MLRRDAILIDSSFLVAFYDVQDDWHRSVLAFLESCTNELVTTESCVTEVMWLLAASWQLQNEFLHAVAQSIFACEPLETEDFHRIKELNQQYADLPGDFADLSLVAVSERLNLPRIATLDKDFDIYRRYRREPFERISLR